MMTLTLAKRIIDNLVRLPNLHALHKGLTLIWHGGEPLLWGIENYRRIFAYTEKFRNKVSIRHAIQTNLSLINEEYIELFLDYNVRVGFSLDGPKELNDACRKKIDGSGTYDTIMENLYKCRDAGLSIGAIIVAGSAFKSRIPELYRFVCDHKLNFKFNPLFVSGEANDRKELSLTPIEYARMSIELFDLWFFDRKNQIMESTFLDIACAFLPENRRIKGCMFSKNCQDNFMAISPRGDIFPCGRFCDTDTTNSYGNIRSETLETILQRRKTFAQYKRAEIINNSGCNDCSFFNICHGGCLHDGYLSTGTFESKTLLCVAYKMIFTHIQKRVQEIIPLD